MIVAIWNPVSGQGLGRDRLRWLEHAATELGRDLKVLRTNGPADVSRAATDAIAMRPEAIALVGGDGSIGELTRSYAALDAADRPPLLIVPAGRGNSFYKALLSDAPWKDYVLRALERPYVRAIDAAVVEESGDTWALGFSIGYLHDCVASTRYFRGLRGRTLYAAAGAFAAMRLRPFRVEVTVDARPVYAGGAAMVALGGGPFRGGRLHLFPVADLTDGLLDVIVVEDVSARRFANVLRAAGTAAHLELPEVHAFRGAEVRISSREPMRCELDGTIYPWARDAITLRCLPAALPVIFPLWTWDDAPSAPA